MCFNNIFFSFKLFYNAAMNFFKLCHYKRLLFLEWGGWGLVVSGGELLDFLLPVPTLRQITTEPSILRFQA